MKTRRDFVKLSAAASLWGATQAATGAESAAVRSGGAGATGAAGTDRTYWTQIAARLATPLLTSLAARRLKLEMPVESHPSSKDRPQYTYLEGVGRLLAGLAPWLELGADATPEGRERGRFAALARAGIDAGTDPASPDFLNFSQGRQPLVDAAFLAQALLRAPGELWRKLEPRVQRNVIAAMISSRPIPAGENNWKLFATTVEVFLQGAGAKRDDARLFEGIRKHRDWYVGDGMYGDGPEFHWDYYNSFVIQPMLVEALDAVADEAAEWKEFRRKALERLTRYAAIQERSIAPDGTYPIIGRSIAYRAGAFQGLAQAAWRGLLPKEVSPAQARVALTAVIRRTLEAPGTFDAKGWLRIGLAGHQPGLGETYISTGSLYLCSVALLPLGLPATDPFWSAPAAKTTWEKVWAGVDLPVDKAIKSPR
ncbi:DUF2264 domain-containing protein [Horticoccus sp. 23ND18S-11]|uniref:DUF2264 domain-containing protein n=1 Tax=Horticoccus sp. 23ND18S-11 TaxID=3391832 RepID=UPI0039C9A393